MSWEKEKKKKTQKFSSSNRKNVTEIDEDGNESVLNISENIKFIVSPRLIVTSLSNLVDNLTKRVHKIECKDCDFFSWIWKC